MRGRGQGVRRDLCALIFFRFGCWGERERCLHVGETAARLLLKLPLLLGLLAVGVGEVHLIAHLCRIEGAVGVFAVDYPVVAGPQRDFIARHGAGHGVEHGRQTLVAVALCAGETGGLEDDAAGSVDDKAPAVIRAALRTEVELYLVVAAASEVGILAPLMVGDEAAVELADEVFVEHAAQVGHVGEARAVGGRDVTGVGAHGVAVVGCAGCGHQTSHVEAIEAVAPDALCVVAEVHGVGVGSVVLALGLHHPSQLAANPFGFAVGDHYLGGAAVAGLEQQGVAEAAYGGGFVVEVRHGEAPEGEDDGGPALHIADARAEAALLLGVERGMGDGFACDGVGHHDGAFLRRGDAGGKQRDECQ